MVNRFTNTIIELVCIAGKTSQPCFRETIKQLFF